MNFVQCTDFPSVVIPPAVGSFSYRNAWNEVMSAFHDAGFRIREPKPERLQLSPCHDFAWFFVVAGLDRHHEVLVVDGEFTPEMDRGILSGAFGVITQSPDAAFHIYSAHPVTARLKTALSDTPAGRFLRRVTVEFPVQDIRPMGVQYVAPRIAQLLGECWNQPVDLDSPGATLQWLEDVVMAFRGDADPDDLLDTPGSILTPPLAAIGLVVAEVLRRHLPGTTKIHASGPRAGFERTEDDRLSAQDWSFVVVVAGGEELEYVYGPGAVFGRYCQGRDQELVSLLPAEIAFPESDQAAAYVKSLPDD
jgi:hypothetical protein